MFRTPQGGDLKQVTNGNRHTGAEAIAVTNMLDVPSAQTKFKKDGKRYDKH